jgi:hypothetical protein
MANRYQLLIETPKANLSIGMRRLNGIYSQSFNHRHNRVGHLFRNERATGNLGRRPPGRQRAPQPGSASE